MKPRGILTSCSLLVLGLATEPGSYAQPGCVSLPGGAVAWWRSQSNNFDAVGVNDALPRYTYFAPTYTPGKVGTALNFQLGLSRIGTNYIMVPASGELDLGTGTGLTIEGWIKPGSQSGFRPIIEWNDRAGNIGAGLNLNGSALEASLTEVRGAIRRIVLRSTPGTVITSVWQHVALTFDRSSGLAILYFNGATVGQTNVGPFVPKTDASIFLAFRPSGINGGSVYSGGLDEFAIYNRGLAGTEIQSIALAGSAGKCIPPPVCIPPANDFVAWWRGETNTRDSVDGNDGLTVGNVFFLPGVVSLAPFFLSGYMRIPASSNLNLGAGSGLTIETWVMPGSFSGYSLYRTSLQELVGWRSGAITQGLSLAITNRLNSNPFPYPPYPPNTPLTTRLQANLVDTQGKPHLIMGPPELMTEQVWQHVAITYDKSSGLAVLYFNGNPAAQTNLGIFTPQTSGDLILGYTPFARPGAPPFPVPLGPAELALDELGLYARALTVAEIRAVMLSRSAGKCKQPPVITSQPMNLRVNQGDDLTFLVAAKGNPLLKYQWRWHGTNLPGASRDALMLTNVQAAQAGPYSVRVTNAFGVAVSSNGLLTINRTPVADPSATVPMIVAPLGCAPRIVLDGSRSSDPDGDPLHMYWFKAGESAAFATGTVVIVTLPPGTNFLWLAVDDGQATNATDVQELVRTPAQAVQQLIQTVLVTAAAPRPLVASLTATLHSLERGSEMTAVNQLRAFEHQIDARLEQPDPAAQLTATADAIIEILTNGCDPAGTLRHQINKIDQLANGKLKLKFRAPHGTVAIIEASTNLIEWEMIGTATEFVPSQFEFEAANNGKLPYQFYRVVSP
jgi:hypothetical protein